MSKSRLSWKVFLAVGGLALLGVAVYNYISVYCCAPIQLTISGGNVCPLRSEMARRICAEVHNSGVILDVAVETNSEVICEAVDSGELDLGLALGGFPPDAHPHVRQVATLGVEPLHLLVRGELLTDAAQPLELLRGRRVSLGEKGSNGAMLASELLRFGGLRPTTKQQLGDFQPVYSREDDLLAKLAAWKDAPPPVREALAERLPDAVFIVDSIPSPLVDALVKTAGYQLVPLPYATALHLDNRRDHNRQPGHWLEESRLEPCTIPAYAYGIRPAVPPQECETFGLRLILVAHKNVTSNAVLRLLRALEKGAADRYQIDLVTGTAGGEFPLHPGAVAFSQGRRPQGVNELLEPLTNFLSVVGAGAAGAFALWGFLRGLRAVHPDVHLKQIDRIERLLAGSELDESAPTLPREFIDFLEGHLAQIKQAAINDYSKGRLNNDDALMSILTLIADTRHMLVQRRKQLCLDTIDAARPRRVAEAA